MSAEPKEDHGRNNAEAWADEIRTQCARHRKAEEAERWDEDAEDADQIADEAREGALSVEVRSGWHMPGEKDAAEPVEFRIVLTFGGPSLELIGKLGLHDEPQDAELRYCSGWQPWTRYMDAREVDAVSLPEALDWFAGLFYFGSG
jgi:hypothetical protein